MQSVECKNVISDLSRACSLEGMLRQLTHPAREEARQARERTRVCLHFCVYVHTYMRVMNWPLPWMSPCVFLLMLTKPGNSSFFLYRTLGIMPWTFFQLSTLTYRKSAQRLLFEQYLYKTVLQWFQVCFFFLNNRRGEERAQVTLF